MHDHQTKYEKVVKKPFKAQKLVVIIYFVCRSLSFLLCLWLHGTGTLQHTVI